jgi:hypothetical protein
MLSLVTNMVVGVFLGMGVKSIREELRVDAEVRRGLGWLGVCWASGDLSLGLARRGGVGTPADADCVA